MTLFNRIFSFELIYSIEIFISSNKNHHYFLQFNGGIFILFLAIFRTYQIISDFFCCVVLLNPWKCVIPLSYGKPLSLKIYFVHFLSSEGPCDKQNHRFVVI